MLTAPVNKIIPFSLVDGPGSRCSVFLQGCNIACAYCHNPETQRMCVACGACVEACPAEALTLAGKTVEWDESVCVGCDSCIKVCPTYASPKINNRTPKQVFKTVASYQPFIRGVTVSGGECMLHPDWLRELFTLCKGAGLGTLIDSNGTVDFSAHEGLLAVTDGVMLDVKAWDEGIFRHLTGSGNAVVKRNLTYLAERDKIEELRIVVVPGWNDPEATITGIASTLGERTATTTLKLITFRHFGVKGELSTAPSPTDKVMQHLATFAKYQGFTHIEIR